MDLKKARKIDEKCVFGTYRRTQVLFVKGKGPYVYDDSGKKYLDLLSGIGVNALGYGNQAVAKAVCDQAKKLSHVSNLYYTEPMLHLAERMTKNAKMEKAFFGNSGAEANEAAIKLVRRYHSEILGDNRREIICFNGSFHGRTLANVSATGQEAYRKGFDPLPAGFSHVNFNDVSALKKAVGKNTAAIMLEPVQGESGVFPATAEFMKTLDELRAKHGVQLIYDEVQSGSGRTGKWFAYMHYGVKPDVITVSKPIGGGLPLGIMMAQGDVVKGFAPGSHASTFGANPVACAAANAFLDEVEARSLLKHVDETGKYIQKRLKEAASRTGKIVEVRGKGFMIGVQVDADAPAIAAFFLKNGVLVNAIRQNIIRILPPYIIEKKHADLFVDLLVEFLAA